MKHRNNPANILRPGDSVADLNLRSSITKFFSSIAQMYKEPRDLRNNLYMNREISRVIVNHDILSVKIPTTSPTE